MKLEFRHSSLYNLFMKVWRNSLQLKASQTIIKEGKKSNIDNSEYYVRCFDHRNVIFKSSNRVFISIFNINILKLNIKDIFEFNANLLFIFSNIIFNLQFISNQERRCRQHYLSFTNHYI